MTTTPLYPMLPRPMAERIEEPTRAVITHYVPMDAPMDGPIRQRTVCDRYIDPAGHRGAPTCPDCVATLEAEDEELIHGASGNGLHVVCAWCDRVLRQGGPESMISHGLCAACAETLR